MIIYKAENLVNGKCYIGQTIKTLKRRRSGHFYEIKRGSDKLFHRAIKKYGWKKFNWEIICTCNTIDQLNFMEIFFIKMYSSYMRNNGYNMTLGGDRAGTSQCRIYKSLSKETKKKISESKRGVSWGSHSKETKKKMSKVRMGIIFTDDHKKKLSKARKTRIITKETRDKTSNTSTGKINIKKFICIDQEGNEYITENGLTDFCRNRNLSGPNMHKVLNGTRKNHKGWTIKRYKE